MAKNKQPPTIPSGKDIVSKPVKEKVNRGDGYIKNTKLPLNGAHNSGNGIFWLEERRLYVQRNYLSGKSQWEIAKELNVNQSTIQADIEHIRSRWKIESLQSMDDFKSKELAKLDELERKATEEYLRSRRNAKIVTRYNESGMVDKEGKRVVIEGRIGDAKFLQQIAWCIEMRCKIMGVLKDVKNVNVSLLSLNWEDISTDNGANTINNQILELEAHTNNKENDNESK